MKTMALGRICVDQGLFLLSDMTLGAPVARAQSGRLGEARLRLASFISGLLVVGGLLVDAIFRAV